MAMIGALLTIGLIRPWGEVFPRSLPWIGGRRVPPALAIIPAAPVSMLVTSAGLKFVRLVVFGTFTLGDLELGLGENWAAIAPELLWPAGESPWRCHCRLLPPPAGGVPALSDVAEMLLDVRVYRIRDGRREEFHALARDETIPMARRHGQLVVGFGPSMHDQDSYYLIRAFADEEERRRSLASLYESEEWLRDYDERVMGLIEFYQTAVFTAPAEAVDRLVDRSPQGG